MLPEKITIHQWMNHLHPLMFTVFSCSFLTLKGEKISSGRAKDEKQNKDIHCIDTTDLKIKKHQFPTDVPNVMNQSYR